MIWSEHCDELLKLADTSPGMVQTDTARVCQLTGNARLPEYSRRLAGGRTSLRTRHACWSPRSCIICASVFPGYDVNLHHAAAS